MDGMLAESLGATTHKHATPTTIADAPSATSHPHGNRSWGGAPMKKKYSNGIDSVRSRQASLLGVITQLLASRNLHRLVLN